MVTGAPARNLSKKAPMLRLACCSTPGVAEVPSCAASEDTSGGAGVPAGPAEFELGRARSCRALKRTWPNEDVKTRRRNSVTSKARLAHARLIIRQLPDLELSPRC